MKDSDVKITISKDEMKASLELAQPEDGEEYNYSEVENMYNRLSEGRDAFTKMYELNINAVSEISKLDLEIQFYTERL